MTGRVMVAGIGQDGTTPIGAVFSEHGIIIPPYSNVGGYGPTNVAAVGVTLYAPGAGLSPVSYTHLTLPTTPYV